VLALSIPARDDVLQVLVECPEGLAELRAVLLQQQEWRVREGISSGPRSGASVAGTPVAGRSTVRVRRARLLQQKVRAVEQHDHPGQLDQGERSEESRAPAAVEPPLIAPHRLFRALACAGPCGRTYMYCHLVLPLPASLAERSFPACAPSNLNASSVGESPTDVKAELGEGVKGTRRRSCRSRQAMSAVAPTGTAVSYGWTRQSACDTIAVEMTTSNQFVPTLRWNWVSVATAFAWALAIDACLLFWAGCLYVLASLL
jgi:hypothetical protein